MLKGYQFCYLMDFILLLIKVSRFSLSFCCDFCKRGFSITIYNLFCVLLVVFLLLSKVFNLKYYTSLFCQPKPYGITLWNIEFHTSPVVDIFAMPFCKLTLYVWNCHNSIPLKTNMFRNALCFNIEFFFVVSFFV